MAVFKVFISHTNKPNDIGIIRKAASVLNCVEATPYIAEDDRQPGNYLSEKIKSNIASSDVAIGIWTRDASESAYVNQELGFAEGKGIGCILFVERGVAVKGFFVGREHIEFDRTDPELGMKHLLQFVHDRKQRKEETQYWNNLITIGLALLAGIGAAAAVALLASTRKQEDRSCHSPSLPLK